MRLLGTFFTILSAKETDGGFEPRLVSSVEPLIRLEPDNVIFKAHFPNYPITPGAVQIRVATELLENHLGKAITLERVRDLKFIQPLFPGAEVAYSFTKLLKEENRLKVELTVRSGGIVFSRMSLEYACEGCPIGASMVGELCRTTSSVTSTGSVTVEPVAELAEAPGLLKDLKACVIVPVYNNAKTIKDVVQRTLRFCEDVIVVDDGSTDGSSEGLEKLGAVVVRYKDNRGKGYALKTGFKEAKARGFERAITIDADGQHFPEDIPVFAAQAREDPEAMLVGSRNLQMENMPGGNTFANKFSNFWFRLQTGVNLPDTQSGFRLYQLNRIGGLHLLTYRYEAELELLVFQCWKGVRMRPVGIKVYYPPEGERVTHFRPFWDFFRISVLNTVLCILALLYGRPARMLRGK